MSNVAVVENPRIYVKMKSIINLSIYSCVLRMVVVLLEGRTKLVWHSQSIVNCVAIDVILVMCSACYDSKSMR